MSYYEWHAYVPVAEKRRQAERKLAKLEEAGTIRCAGEDRGPHDYQELLGQILVRQP